VGLQRKRTRLRDDVTSKRGVKSAAKKLNPRRLRGPARVQSRLLKTGSLARPTTYLKIVDDLLHAINARGQLLGPGAVFRRFHRAIQGHHTVRGIDIDARELDGLSATSAALTDAVSAASSTFRPAVRPVIAWHDASRNEITTAAVNDLAPCIMRVSSSFFSFTFSAWRKV
jgi:hypothetical protein